MIYNPIGASVVDCTDPSGKEPPNIQVGLYRVIASGSLGSVLGSILPLEWQQMWVQKPALSALFPILNTFLRQVSLTWILYKLCPALQGYDLDPVISKRNAIVHIIASTK